MEYGIRPSPTSRCWDCKYYDVESRYISIKNVLEHIKER